MNTFDFTSVVNNYLEEHGYKAHVKRLDSFTGKEGICIRQISMIPTCSYYDGEREYSLIYQIIVRRRSEEAARNVCAEIFELLLDADLSSENGSYRFYRNEVYTPPQELSLSENLFYAWETRFVATVERG